MRKTCPSDVSFAAADFPPLKTANHTLNSTSTASSPSVTAVASSLSESATPPYDYKVELDCLSKEIKTNLCPQFDRLFAQLDKKIDSLVKAQEDQEKVNINVSKQLNFLVENVTKLLKHLMYQLNNNSQSPRSSDGHS